jgi:hypothetical protein
MRFPRTAPLTKAVGLVSLVAASMAQAQAAPSIDGRAKHSIAIETWSTGLVGIGLRVGDRTDLLLEAGGRLSERDGEDGRVLTLRPAIKRYLGPTDGSIAPYMLFGLKAEWTRGAFGTSPFTSQRIGGTADLGLEWFPTQRVSVGGHVGVELLALRSDSPSLLIGPDPVSTGYEIGTVSSGLRLRFFF